MTTKALSLLQGDKDGFFLQVEGASIDKQDHAANACAQIGETVAFDEAIGVALDYQRKHPDTLVVVTADHSHTSQIVGEDTTGNDNPTGYSNNLITADDQMMRVTYGTAGGTARPAAPPSQQHTGAAVPVMAHRPRRFGRARDDRPHRPVPAAAGRRPAPRALGDNGTGRPARHCAGRLGGFSARLRHDPDVRLRRLPAVRVLLLAPRRRTPSRR